MNKTVCDKCEKEFKKYKNKYWLKEFDSSIVWGYREIDLCKECEKKFVKFLRSDK